MPGPRHRFGVRGYRPSMRKPVLAMFVVAAVAIGLLVLLLIGVFRVDEDGGSGDDAGARTPQLTPTASY